MAPRFPKLVGVARELTAASRASRSGVAARDLALERYAARHPQSCVTRDESRRPSARGIRPSASLEGSDTFAGQQREKIMGPYGPINKVVFEADEKNLDSDEAMWALYERWCKHFRCSRITRRWIAASTNSNTLYTWCTK